MLFGIGLALSGMIDPERVLGFLDVAGAWDPSLALVLAGAVGVSALGHAIQPPVSASGAKRAEFRVAIRCSGTAESSDRPHRPLNAPAGLSALNCEKKMRFSNNLADFF